MTESAAPDSEGSSPPSESTPLSEPGASPHEHVLSSRAESESPPAPSVPDAHADLTRRDLELREREAKIAEKELELRTQEEEAKKREEERAARRAERIKVREAGKQKPTEKAEPEYEDVHYRSGLKWKTKRVQKEDQQPTGSASG